MENGFDVNCSDEVIEEWQTGQDLSQSPSEVLYSCSEQYVEQSVETLRDATFSPEYSLGDMTDYDVQTLGTLAIYGVCAGFALSIGVALLSYAVAAVMRVFRGITTE